jgi:DNA-binding response OmpR family regulator
MRTEDRVDREVQEKLNVVVLCLDDHYSTTLAYWLGSAGVRVEIVNSGRQAKQLLRSSDRQVLVTDRVLPPWPGLSRLASLKRTHKHLRIVTIDRGDADSRYVAMAAGADAVVSPPLRRDVTVRAIGVAQGSDRR